MKIGMCLANDSRYQQGYHYELFQMQIQKFSNSIKLYFALAWLSIYWFVQILRNQIIYKIIQTSNINKKPENLMSKLLYTLQWSYFVVNQKPKNYQKLLTAFPTNLFQLNFWCEVMILIRIEDLDVPVNAVFYLKDQQYQGILAKICESDRLAINCKINLVCYMYSIGKNQGLIRNLEEAVMSAFAIYSFNHSQADKLKQNAIKKFLQSQVNFLKDSTLQKVSQYFKNRIFPQKQLKNVQDLILGTFIIQQVSKNSSNNDQLRKFLSFYKKQNVLSSLIEHLGKYKNIDTLNMVIQLADSLDKSIQVFKFFETHPEIFYSFFWQLSQFHDQQKYKPFITFMVQNSSVRTIVMHNILFNIESGNICPITQVPQLLNSQSNSIFDKMKVKPQQTASKCLQYYLKHSNFTIPSKKIDDTYYDPLSFVAVVRKFWQHPFHSQIINYCLWILMDRRFAKINSLKLKGDQSKVYCRSLFLAVFHICINYKMGTFLSYYAIQNNRIFQLFSLQSLPYLLSNTPNIAYLPWLPFYISNQLSKILRFQCGYRLLRRVLSLKQKNYSIELNHNNLFNAIELDIVNKKNHKFLLANKKDVLQLLSFFIDSGRYSKDVKDYADKLLRAIPMIQRDY